MTSRTLSTDTGRWELVIENFVAAKEAADAIEHLADCDATDRIQDVLDDATERLFSVAAPNVRAITNKLEIFWDDGLADEGDYSSSYKRRIIGDLRRLQLLEADVGEEDASGGMNLEQVAADWTNALQEYNQHAQFLETGPSDRWQYSKKSDIVALMDEAEAKVLSLHAPNLAAVIRKLELLWADDRFDPVSNSADHCRILRDLHRLECQIAS